MQIRVGSDIVFDCPQATPMLLMLNVHPSRVGDVIASDALATTPAVPVASYIDGFGNRCSRIVAPAGTLRISTRAVVRDGGEPERIVPADTEHPVETLPDECLMFLLGSRYCETDRLSDVAWSLFGRSPGGTQRVQAICDYVHNHIVFDYQRARATRTAFEAFSEMTGVCRDFAHLAIAFCRCMNIPARYCTGYLGDIGVPPQGPMDFAAWFEAYVGGQWQVFDPRNNTPRIGRILIARGRDATDVAISNAFGVNTLRRFEVVTEEVAGNASDPGTREDRATALGPARLVSGPC